MSEDLQQYQPQEKQPPKRKLKKAVVFAVLLVASFVGLFFVLPMPNTTSKNILFVVLAMNAIAAMVNLFRTFRPHKP